MTDSTLQGSTFFGNSAASVGIALGLWLVVVLVLFVIQRALIKWLAKRAVRTKTEVDNFFVDMLRKTSFVFVFFLAGAIASSTLTLPPRARLIIGVVAKVALLIQLALWGGELIAALFRKYFGGAARDGSSTTVEAISYVARLVFWVLIVLVGLESFGIHVTALVAGLGIGGIAIALAVQNILGDVFAALSILFDKPFVVGDLIEAGNYSGTVMHVGIKSTRLRSVTGEQIILANGEMIKNGIRNFERLGQRRAVLITRIAPDTPDEKARQVPGIISKVIEKEDGATLDSSHFKTITDNSFEFETIYYLSSNEYKNYLKVQQSVNFALIEAFRSAGITLISQRTAPPSTRSPEPKTSEKDPGIA